MIRFFNTAAIVLSLLLASQANAKNCSINIYSGERSERIDLDAGKESNGKFRTIMEYSISDIEGPISNDMDIEFLALNVDDLSQAKITQPVIYIEGKNIRKKIVLGPLKSTEKLDNVTYNGGKVGAFKVFAIPGGGIHGHFAEHADENAAIIIKLQSGKTPLCANEYKLMGEHEHDHDHP
jgi:hypothetical protein